MLKEDEEGRTLILNKEAGKPVLKGQLKSSLLKGANIIIAPPDGGYGWVVVMSSFLLQAIGGGIAFSVGVFFVEFLGTFGQGKGATAWIGSINTGLLFGAGRSITNE